MAIIIILNPRTSKVPDDISTVDYLIRSETTSVSLHHPRYLRIKLKRQLGHGQFSACICPRILDPSHVICESDIGNFTSNEKLKNKATSQFFSSSELPSEISSAGSLL